MNQDLAGEITEVLRGWGLGDPAKLTELMPLVYDQLHALAQAAMSRERPDHTLQPTALVHELYCRLTRQRGGNWKDRNHFYTFAAGMMRRILTDYARYRSAEKRGGDSPRVPLSDQLPWLGNSRDEVLAIDQALSALGRLDPRKAQLIELRVYLGCTAEQAAEAMGISKATADRDWTMAKSWLYRQLKAPTSARGPSTDE
jgi:RNA polymerase sigma factor (TIGR02999 family)